jgi:hypothetical protein
VGLQILGEGLDRLVIPPFGAPKFDTLELISPSDFNGGKHLGGLLHVCGSGTLYACVCWHYTA